MHARLPAFALLSSLTWFACADDEGSPKQEGSPATAGDGSVPADAATPLDFDGSSPGVDGAAPVPPAPVAQDTRPRADAAQAAPVDTDARAPEPDAAPTADGAATDGAVTDGAADAASADAAATADAEDASAPAEDAGDPPEDPGELCIALGENCEETSCCDDSACVTSSERPFRACAQHCEDAEDCESGCCTVLLGASHKVCAPALHCEEPEPDPLDPLVPRCSDMQLVADDPAKTYLGDATALRLFASVCNTAGNYGSTFSETSIYAPFGDFGSLNGMYSAYSSFTTTPPRLVCPDGTTVAVVSKNQAPHPERVIDPDQLCEILAASDL